ncbi:site-specific integrase [Ruminococcaceae bacterium OttesenSCG-928-A11]|nr:site-specific integrase [Ruminococcaceae bacterium OttesenSCG-928-A11]
MGKPVKELFEIVGETQLSNNTILYYHRFISSVLSTAVHWQVIPSNPCERVKPPKPENTKICYLDEQEAIRMLEMLEGEEIQFRAAVTVLLFTGMRRGELLGLEWGDIDYQLQTIQIERTSQYLPGVGVFTDETKTKKSQRTIIAPQAALRVLKELQRWQTEQRLALGDKWEHSDRVLVTWNGRPMNPDTLSGQFHKFISKTDLPQVTVHGLRHTNATLQIAQGVPLPNVADHLGHETSVTTAKIYARAIQSVRLATANMLDDLLAPQDKKTG